MQYACRNNLYVHTHLWVFFSAEESSLATTLDISDTSSLFGDLDYMTESSLQDTLSPELEILSQEMANKGPRQSEMELRYHYTMSLHSMGRLNVFILSNNLSVSWKVCEYSFIYIFNWNGMKLGRARLVHMFDQIDFENFCNMMWIMIWWCGNVCGSSFSCSLNWIEM